MNAINSTSAGTLLAALIVSTQIGVTSANAQHAFGLDNWPSGWPKAGAFVEDSKNSQSATRSYKLRFGLRILGRKSKTTRQSKSK